MSEPGRVRPKRVIVVDADNPLVEVHGEFFWREDHDRMVGEARDRGWRDGYAAGFIAGSGSQAAGHPQSTRVQEVVVWRRPSLVRRLIRWAVFVVVVTVLLPMLLAVIVAGAQRR
jgi:hypothetical protein